MENTYYNYYLENIKQEEVDTLDLVFYKKEPDNSYYDPKELYRFYICENDCFNIEEENISYIVNEYLYSIAI